MSRRFDAVLFDFGGVFTESPFRVVENAGSDLGAEPGRILEIVFGPYHDDTDHPWHRLERGEVSLGDACAEIQALGAREGIDADPLRILSTMSAGGAAREPVVECVRSLRRARYKTALVTNNAREFREFWWGVLPLDELFDVVVDSSDVGMRKPDPRIFLHTLELLGSVAPERAVFLDDYVGNVDAAIRIGLQGIVVGEDPRDALAVLDELIGT